MSFPALKDAQERKQAKEKELATIFEEAGQEMDLAKVKSINGTNVEKASHIRQLNDELGDIGQEVENLKGVEKASERARHAPDIGNGEPGSEPGGRGSGQPSAKSVGKLFTESDAYKQKAGANGPEAHLDVELKTLFETSAGWDPEVIRTGRVVEDAQRPIQVVDVIPQTTTSQAAVQYMEETTFTNNAAETAEGTAYGEAALALTEQSSLVRKIAVYLPVTDEQLEDEPQARGYIDNRLPFMLRQRLDAQILTGDGVAPNLTGILNTSGIQSQAKGTDPTPDAVYKAMTKVQTGTGQAMPSAAIFHPNDWQSVRLLRTSDGIYIWGNPSDAGPERIWGLRVVKAQAITQGSALVGDFVNFVELATRRGIDVQVSNSHSTFFTQGKQAIRADLRVALPVYRPAAFCEVTGL